MILSSLGQFLAAPALLDQVRLQPSAFTRKRSLTLPRLAAMMIGGMQASVQAELDGLFAQLTASAVRVRGVIPQAFSKARQGLSARLFGAANAHLLAMAQPLIEMPIAGAGCAWSPPMPAGCGSGPGRPSAAAV